MPRRQPGGVTRVKRDRRQETERGLMGGQTILYMKGGALGIMEEMVGSRVVLDRLRHTAHRWRHTPACSASQTTRPGRKSLQSPS
jgi:hypothetical protein